MNKKLDDVNYLTSDQKSLDESHQVNDAVKEWMDVESTYDLYLYNSFDLQSNCNKKKMMKSNIFNPNKMKVYTDSLDDVRMYIHNYQMARSNGIDFYKDIDYKSLIKSQTKEKMKSNESKDQQNEEEKERRKLQSQMFETSMKEKIMKQKKDNEKWKNVKDYIDQ